MCCRSVCAGSDNEPQACQRAQERPPLWLLTTRFALDSCQLPPLPRPPCAILHAVQVVDVKAKIQETQGDDFPAASLNVIYQGKVRKQVPGAPPPHHLALLLPATQRPCRAPPRRSSRTTTPSRIAM